MVLSLFRHKKLLEPAGPGGRDAAPLRAFGKLGLASEYVDVGCADLEAGRWFRDWVDHGCKRLEQASPDQPLRVRGHRILLSQDGGKVWVVACVWNSSDKRSEQGSQREFPFSLFVIVPAPDRARRFSAAPSYCIPLWEQLEEAFSLLSGAKDRGDCERQVRRSRVLVTPRNIECNPEFLTAARHVPLAGWLEDCTAGSCLAEELLFGLQMRLGLHARSRGQEPKAWRLPMPGNLGILAKLGVWMKWFQVNLGVFEGDLGLFLPTEPMAGKREMCVLLRESTFDDFAFLTTDQARLDQAAGPSICGAGSLVDGADAFLRAISAQLPIEARTLADFALYAFPQPVGGW